MSETQLYRYATPHYYTIDDFPDDHQDLTMGQFYPSPWKGGWWRIGDAVAYNLTTTRAVPSGSRQNSASSCCTANGKFDMIT